MEIRIVLNQIRRWFWLLLVGLILGGAGGYFASRYQTPIYQASAKVMVIKAPDSAASNINNISDQELIQTYIQLLATKPVLEETSDLLGFDVQGGQIQANQIGSTKLLQIIVQDTRPDRAMQIANQIVEVLIQQNEILQASLYSSSEQSLQVQIAQIEEQIATLQTDINQLSEENVELEIQQLAEEKLELENTIFSIQRDIAELELEAEALSPKIVVPGEPIPTLRPSQQSILSDLHTELAQKQFRLNLAEQSYFALVLPEANAENNSEQSRQGQQQATLALYQQIYSTLLGNYEAVRLARLQSTANVVQVEPATMPRKAIAPSPLGAIGAVAGLILASGIAFLIEFLDVNLKSVADIERVLQTPVIGYLTDTLELRQENGQPYTADAPHSPVAESLRNVRANLDFARAEKPLKSLVVTSPGAEQGKTTLLCNLAVLIAQAGLRVVIIDADLRRPRIHRSFNISNDLGLSSLLLKPDIIDEPELFNNYITDTLQQTSIERLTIITSGPIPTNPSELLGSNRMAQLIKRAEETSDIVLIDSPPLLVADPSILASRVDGVLFVLDYGKTKADIAQKMMHQLHRAGSRIVGVILNRIPRRAVAYETAYQYHEATAYQPENSLRERLNGYGEPSLAPKKGVLAKYRSKNQS